MEGFQIENNRSSVLYSFQETGLPPPLASRFDVIWLMRDEIALQNDERIAKHIWRHVQEGQQNL